jgi:hypothetical protein
MTGAGKLALPMLGNAGEATDTKAGSYVNGYTSGGSQGEAVGLRLRFLPYEFTYMAFQISRSP